MVRIVSLLLQILHNPLRQRFGGCGVLASIQLTIDHDVGLEKSRTLELPSEFLDLVLQKETNILRW